jgi:GTPase SAR1 family protein
MQISKGSMMPNNYVRDAVAIMLVFDRSNLHTLANLESYIDQIKNCCINDPVYVLVAHKSDLDGSSPE